MLMTMKEALRSAMDEEMARDENVFLIGEDLCRMGGPMMVTQGLGAKYGAERVLETPISEAGFAGAAIGAAMCGMRPIVEIGYADFLPLISDQLLNTAAKIRYSHESRVFVPLVVRTASGCGARSGYHHSQMVEAWFANTPGIKIMMPSNAYDAKGMLKTAIRDNDPVLFIEPKYLYNTRAEVPDEEYFVPMGKASVKREGTDVTIICYGPQVPKALAAAAELEKEGISAEVIDLRTLRPMDTETIIESVKKTNHVVISHEANQFCGMGAEVAAQISEFAFGYVDGPIKRVCAPECPIPFAPSLEDAYMPSAQQIAEAAKATLV